MTRMQGELKREVVTAKGETLIVTLTSYGIMTRVKGTRTTFGPVTWGAIHDRCAQVTAYTGENAPAPRRKRVSRSLTKGR